MRNICLTLLCIFLLAGCGQGDIKVKTDNSAENELQDSVIEIKQEEEKHEESVENELPIETEINNEIGRPVITHKYDVVILCQGLQGMNLFSENVVSVIDPEDGELPFINMWGVVGPQPDEVVYNQRHPKDSLDAVQKYGPFYTGLGYGVIDPDGTRPVGTTAYDSEGHVSYKEFKIRYSSDNPEDASGILTVNVEDLRARSGPSSDGEAIGYVWPNAKYYYYESNDNEGYTWYRIGDNMWIADGGGWLSYE